MLEARCEGFAWAVVDPARVGETAGLLETILVLGMELLPGYQLARRQFYAALYDRGAAGRWPSREARSS